MSDRQLVVRNDPHDIRVGDEVRGNGVRTFRSDGPALPGRVVLLEGRYVVLVKSNGRRVRVLRSAVWADGKDRRSGYTVIGEKENDQHDR